MVIVEVKSTPNAGFKKKFLNEFNKVAITVRKEVGCLEYEIYQKDFESLDIFIFERWESKEALDAHLKTNHMLAFFAKTEDWFDLEKELRVYEVQ